MQIVASYADLFVDQDYQGLRLKDDHKVRPLWVCSNGRIILEAFSILFDQAQDFLTAIAEPLSRPEHVHEYRLTEYSLYAAVSVGLSTESIIAVLELLSKSEVSDELQAFIRQHTSSYGKIKVVLRENRYWLETKDETVRQMLTGDAVIAASVVHVDHLQQEQQQQQQQQHVPGGFDLGVDGLAQGLGTGFATSAAAPLAARYQELLQQQEELGAVAWRTRSLEIAKSQIEDVKRRCADLSLPALEEYDFRADKINPDLKIDLKSTTKLRPYQERSLGKLFSNGRARSGVIVLPCGAGKTLVGVTAACTIKKSCLVLCTSSVSVEQWAREFRFWSSSQDGQVARFTSDTKEKFNGSAGIMISTYTMVTYSGKRAYDAQQLMDFIQSREWGLLLLDEVHVVPADMFRKVFTIVAAHAKLGLTATLVREDNKIENLNYLIGPKLYEANWMELAKSGHIANVQCAEVWCTMTPEFYREYLREKSRKRQLLYTMNPRKVQACQYLISFHEAMGDKIIVFSDNVFALKHYATTLNKPFIYGGTSQSERIRVLQQFRFNPALNTIFISKVGDTSIDLPEATCLIQISSHYGSRRQEAQRLGRILRAKKGADAGFNAFFYSLVSRDTEEMYYATKRQQFLVDQGYNFRIITNIEGMDSIEGLAYANLKEQLELLNTVLISSEADYDEEADDQDADAILGGGSSSSSGWMKRSSGSTLQSLSGADSMAYLEFNRGTSSGMAKSRNAHAATGSGSGSGP
ncbi:P-loop containing nucleoside triphosphate hydrolase protein [Entophlyctis helioformis]|nr:P-loop containing nucleoside triphosphate hydrolase protein [Entophlyctis helioformis]